MSTAQAQMSLDIGASRVSLWLCSACVCCGVGLLLRVLLRRRIHDGDRVQPQVKDRRRAEAVLEMLERLRVHADVEEPAETTVRGGAAGVRAREVERT